MKSNNTFLCTSTTQLKFLDFENYTAPGSNYSKYLSAYNITEEKCVICYQYIGKLAKLDESKLQEHKESFPKLKNSNIANVKNA